jgi:hypothetical protein
MHPHGASFVRTSSAVRPREASTLKGVVIVVVVCCLVSRFGSRIHFNLPCSCHAVRQSRVCRRMLGTICARQRKDRAPPCLARHLSPSAEHLLGVRSISQVFEICGWSGQGVDRSGGLRRMVQPCSARAGAARLCRWVGSGLAAGFVWGPSTLVMITYSTPYFLCNSTE